MSNTSFAVLAKARSKFGKRLTDKDYSALLACQSVTEVMLYLKSYTRYSSALNDINERDVHRGHLESLLRQNLFYEFDSLCRYESNISSGLSRYVVQNTEAEQIVRFLILLNSNSTEKFIYQFPSYFLKHTEIDINKLANAKNYDDFLAALSKSDYAAILKQFKPDEKGILPISDIENRLYDYVYTNLFEIINKTTKGKERRELKSIFMTLTDYRIFSSILRLKKYYSLPPEVIKNSLPLKFSTINEKTIDLMCKAESSAEVFSVMQSTGVGKLIDRLGYVYASDIHPRVKYRLARKNMHFSNNPAVVMISYMFVTETELMNIICLIEGIRYKLDTNKIKSLLIY